MKPTSTQWQLSREAATRYEQIIVPNILGPFARTLVEWSAPPLGATVLDIGCGTGAAARYAATLVGPSGRVIGVDVNAGMIAKAKSLPLAEGAAIEWHEQSAYQLPMPDQSVDNAISAQVVQFLQDKPLAFREMARVLKKGGSVAFSVWCHLPESPYFHAQVDAITNHISADVAAGLRAAFSWADVSAIHAALTEASFTEIEIKVQQLDLPLPDLTAFIPQYISATPLAAGYNAASPAAQQAVIDEMIARLAPYNVNGRMQVPFCSHMVRARK